MPPVVNLGRGPYLHLEVSAGVFARISGKNMFYVQRFSGIKDSLSNIRDQCLYIRFLDGTNPIATLIIFAWFGIRMLLVKIISTAYSGAIEVGLSEIPVQSNI